MEADQNHKPSTSCFSQLESTRKESRRSVKPAGKEDTTRREESAEICVVQTKVSERMIDMHRKVYMWKAFGELSVTIRGPSAVLRNKPARGGKVMQKSITNNRLLPPACRFLATTGMVLPIILKRPMPQPRPFSNRYDENGSFTTRQRHFQKLLRYWVCNSNPTTCALSSTLRTIQEEPHNLTHTPATALQDAVILFPDHQTSGRSRRVQLNNE